MKHPRPFGTPPSKEGGISLTIPLGEGGQRGIVFLILPLSKGGLRGIVPKGEGEKMWIENNIPRPIGTPPSKEGKTLAVFPLGEGGLRGIVFLPLEQGNRKYEKNELFQWVWKSLTGS